MILHKLQHGDTGPCFRPQPATIALDCGIPLEQIGQRHLGTAQHARTSLVFLHKVKSLAVRHHPHLDRSRRRNAVARLGARRLRSRRGLGRRRRRSEPDDAYAEIRVTPHRLAVVANARIPGRELLERDAILGSHVRAVLARLLEVELVAIVHHAWLCGERGGDAVARLGGCGRRLGCGCRLCWRRCGREADHTNAEVGVAPHRLAVVSDTSVPGCELLQGDAVFRGHIGAVLARDLQVELVAVFYHTRLGRQRRSDSIARFGAGGCGCWRSSRRRSSWHTSRFAISLDAVGLVGVEVIAVLINERILQYWSAPKCIQKKRWSYPAKKVFEGSTELTRH